MKTIHYGIILGRAIKNKGIKKKYIAEQLGISRVWLDELLITGNFNNDLLPIVKKIIKR